MKFEVKTSELNNAIRIASRGVSKVSGNNLLDGILFSTENGNITLYSTDLRINIKTVLECNVIEEGKFILNANLISEVARKMQGENCMVDINNNLCTIKSERSTLKFACSPADEFPKFPTLEENGRLTISGEDFINMVSKSRVSVSLDENRLIYTGIKFESKDGFIEASSLDGYRISITKKKTDYNNGNISFIVPSQTLYDVEKLIKEDEELLIRLTDSHAMISFSNTEIYTRLFEGDFFDYNSLVSTDGTTEVIVNKKDLSDALDRAMIVSKGNVNMVRLDIKDNNMNIRSKGSLGETNDDLEIEKSGENLLIAFNPKYMRDGIAEFSEDNIKMVFKSSTDPLTIFGLKDIEYTYILLPVRLQ
ncbi:MAG: DNA polymerase III subunit beta [Ezakiella sp.]|nr:DNA polymerase III subunit beta [Ezakiella sp.]MDD7471237.1 DNA polymerase III subunit beta [Bacillota bacterium]MDY3923374.1 DNA polymerase III subunit beta [Ezakiella sp.]